MKHICGVVNTRARIIKIVFSDSPWIRFGQDAADAVSAPDNNMYTIYITFKHIRIEVMYLSYIIYIYDLSIGVHRYSILKKSNKAQTLPLNHSHIGEFNKRINNAQTLNSSTNQIRPLLYEK